MLSREDLIQISITRLKEARSLYEAGHYDGAAYLAGYSLETGLKARICKVLDSNYPPKNDAFKSFYTHKFDTLVTLGGLTTKLDEAKKLNPNLAVNWSLATNWTEANRYLPIGSKSKEQVFEMLNALDDPKDGILTWLTSLW